MEENTELSLEQQLAQAEERGYRRGLNEQIAKQMSEPGQWEGTAPAAAEEPAAGFEILASRRRSIWDLN